MSRGIAEAAASRIGEHARQHGLREIALVLHGGEPLLAGKELIWSLVTAVGRAAGSGVQVRARIQTNGVGLSDDYLRLLDELKVRVQVSLDGGADQHDRHRRFASGRGSYAAVAAGLDRLRKPHYGHLFGGLLCTVDVRNDPIATYEALLAFDPPAIDFQLPHGTWEAPPPGRGQQPRHTPYADWLIAIFDRWYRNRGTSVPMFESVMSLLLLGSSSVESVGMAPSTVVVIETDGSVRQTDSLKGTYHGASASELHVIRDPLDAALLLPGFAAQQIGEKALAPQCLTCPIHHVCGGGQYSHRYRSGSGFANPSVYCPDLMKLIGHIAEIIREDVTFRRDHDG